MMVEADLARVTHQKPDIYQIQSVQSA
jgi:hypothetical protein